MSHISNKSNYVDLGTYGTQDRLQKLTSLAVIIMSFGNMYSHARSSETELLITVFATITIILFSLYIKIERTTLFSFPPDKIIIIRYRIFGFVVREKSIHAQRYMWARVRQQGEKSDFFIEVGTRGFETLNIFTIPYENGNGFERAQDILEDISKLWSIEKKCFQVGIE